MNMTTIRSSRLYNTLVLTVFVNIIASNHLAAHAFIDHTDPVVGSTVKLAPVEVRLLYTQGLEPAFSRVQVFDALGKEVDKKDVRLDPKNDHLLIVSLSPNLSAGKYKVVWRVVSVDTHATEGSFTFQVAP